MRICKFEIKNFKGIENASFEWDDIVVFIGENNSCKSTALQALQCFLGGTQLKDPSYFRDNLCDLEHAIELTAHFCQLSEIEHQAGAVRGRMTGDKWILKKKFWRESQENEIVWREQYYSFSSQENFAEWPVNDNAWGNFPEIYQPLIAQLPERGPRPNNQSREQLRELVRQENPMLIVRSEPNWISNPGGGGNWKSNANSIIPRCVYVKAIHDATDEASSKEASSYGKIVSLVIEKRLMQRPEVIDLKDRIATVLRLFNPDPQHPEAQAEEIRDIENRINGRLNEIIAGTVAIKTSNVDVESMLLPSTYLVLKDRPEGVETTPTHQGHGLQRTLVMTLLQILAEIQLEALPAPEERRAHGIPARSIVLAIEEPELYMHPQMERKMRDVLYRLARQPDFQVVCTTHSPVFLNIAQSQKTIIRAVKGADRRVIFSQVTADIFGGPDANAERERVRLIANFHPTINEIFFARRVVLLEEYSAVVSFQKLAELTGLFERHPHLRHDVTLVDCHGKGNIPMFQRVLNYFGIIYTVLHDEDRGNNMEEGTNARIAELLGGPPRHNLCHVIGPTDLERLLNYNASKDKPYQAVKRIEELHRTGNLPAGLLTALNWVYFGQAAEPH